MDAFEILVIILSITLIILLILSILVVTMVLKLLKQAKMIADKAQSAVEYAESVGRMISSMSTPAFITNAILKQIQQMLSKNQDSKKTKKEDKDV